MNFLYLQKANNFNTMTAVVNKEKTNNSRLTCQDQPHPVLQDIQLREPWPQNHFYDSWTLTMESNKYSNKVTNK